MRRNPKFEWQDAFMRASLTPSEFKVGQAIANRWNGDDAHPYASAEYLSDATGYSVRQVRRALAGLRAKGWIAQVHRGGKRGTEVHASRFRLTHPNVSQRDMGVLPNVTPVSSQRDMGVTQVDQSLDQPIDPSAQVASHSEQPCPRPLAQVDYSLGQFPVETWRS